MQVRIARSLTELDFLRSRWESLYCPEHHTIFQTFAWNRLAAEVFGDREAPYVVYVENSRGAALIPAAVSGGRIGLLGETLFDYRDVLGGGEPLGAAWRELARLGLPLTVPVVQETAAWQGFELRLFSQAPKVERQDAGEFAARHRRAGRLVRRLERVGVEIKQHDGAARELARAIYSRKAAQQGGSLFADTQRVEFMIAALALDPAAVDIYTLESAGGLVAALVTLRDGQARRFYTTWFAPDWAHHSPGIALLFEATRRSLGDGLECDYMTGQQPHKMRFATGSVPLFRVEASADELGRIGGALEMAA